MTMAIVSSIERRAVSLLSRDLTRLIPVWTCPNVDVVLAEIATEIGPNYLLRDNLFLNVPMLIYMRVFAYRQHPGRPGAPLPNVRTTTQSA
jgi:hypothetical protein